MYILQGNRKAKYCLYIPVPLYVRKLRTWAWENAEHHHTKKFSLPKSGILVVRRGQPFKITLTFNRPYNSLNDELKFYFETGRSMIYKKNLNNQFW